MSFDMSHISEPVIGWRVWRVRGAGLHSWAASSWWEAGENVATCLAANHCARPPGRGCMCGFWGLFSPLQALEKARAERAERAPVLGMIRGWGDVAIHGREGFRAERAAVICLFHDWVWDAAAMPCPSSVGVHTLWWHVQRSFGYAPRRPERDDDLEQALPEVAASYGVPLLRMDDAVRHGVLGELGATPKMIAEALRWSESAGMAAAPRYGHVDP